MGEQLHFSMDGEFLTAIARDWFWNMDKPYKKCEELLLSCMMGGNEEEKRHVCQDIIEGRKKLVGVNEFELVDDNVHVRSLGQKVEELQRKMLVNQIREDMIAHPLNYVDRFAMTDSYETLCTNAKHHYIDCSYDASSMEKRVILMHSTTVHGFLPTQTLLQNSMANRFLSRNPTRNSTKPIFGPSLPLGLKQT